MPRAFRIGSISGAAGAWPAQFYLASTTRQLFPMAPPTPYLPPTCPFGDIGSCQVYPHWVVSLLHFIPMGFNLSAFMNTFPLYPQAPLRNLGLPFVSLGSPSYPRAPLHILGLPFVSSGPPSYPRAPLRILGLPFVSSGSPLCPRAPLRILGLPFVSSGSPSYPRAPLRIPTFPDLPCVSGCLPCRLCTHLHASRPKYYSVPLWYMSMCF